MSDEAWLSSHSLHGVQGYYLRWSERQVPTGDVDVLALELWPVVGPTSLNGLHGEDPLEVLALVPALLAQRVERLATAAGLAG